MPKGSGLTKPMKLSAELADIVGKKEASRAECIKQLWAYIKKNNLQDPENKQFFNPDKKMAKVSFQPSLLTVGIQSVTNAIFGGNFQNLFNPCVFLFTDFRQRQDPCLRHGQVLERPPFINRSQPICLYISPIAKAHHHSSF